MVLKFVVGKVRNNIKARHLRDLSKMLYYADVKKDKVNLWGTFLAIQWLRLQDSTAGSMGLIPGWETKILHASSVHAEKEGKGIIL